MRSKILINGEQDGRFPPRVHLAWELPEDKRRGLKARLWRVTYKIKQIGPASQRSAAKDGSSAREYLYTDSADPNLVTGDERNADTGLITRTYPWAPNRPRLWTCYRTDAEWDLDDLEYAHLAVRPADRCTRPGTGSAQMLAQGPPRTPPTWTHATRG